MTKAEIKTIKEDIKFLEDALDTVANFKKNIKNITSLVIEGTWFSKKGNKNNIYNTVSSISQDKTEILLIKQFFTNQEKYLLEKYNSKIDILEKAGIKIKNKYKKELSK